MTCSILRTDRVSAYGRLSLRIYRPRFERALSERREELRGYASASDLARGGLAWKCAPAARSCRQFAAGPNESVPQVLHRRAICATSVPANRLMQLMFQFSRPRTENPRVGGSIPPLATVRSGHMGNTLARTGWVPFDAHALVTEEAQVVLHPAHEPDFLADSLNADVFSLGVMIDPPFSAHNPSLTLSDKARLPGEIPTLLPESRG